MIEIGDGDPLCLCTHTLALVILSSVTHWKWTKNKWKELLSPIRAKMESASDMLRVPQAVLKQRSETKPLGSLPWCFRSPWQGVSILQPVQFLNHISHKETLFYCEGNWALVQVSWRGYGISILGNIKNMPGHGPGQPALDNLAAGAWTQWPTEVASHLNHSVILWSTFPEPQ